MMLDGNIYALDRYMDAVERAEKKCPRCSVCHDPMWEETAYDIGDKLICKDCLKDFYNEEGEPCETCGTDRRVYTVDGVSLCEDHIEEMLIFL